MNDVKRLVPTMVGVSCPAGVLLKSRVGPVVIVLL